MPNAAAWVMMMGAEILLELQRAARYLHSMVAENGPDDSLPQIQCLQCHRINLKHNERLDVLTLDDFGL